MQTIEDVRESLAKERALLERLSQIAPLLASELDGDRLMQRLTDEATALVGAQFGAYFYNVTDNRGGHYMLYTLSGAPREAFDRFGMPRNTAVFAPTFGGEGVVRSDDIRKDPRYGKNAPNVGMPKGHLPVVSYLAVSVRSMRGEVLGGLFFGHERAGVFGEREERAIVAVAALAGAAIDNAQLFQRLNAREAEVSALAHRMRLVNEATQEGIWFWDVASNKVDWNDALLCALGVTREAWGGTFDDWFGRVHPEDQPRLSAALKAHLETRAPYKIDRFRLRTETGEYRWFTTAGQAEWSADGAPLRMAGSVRDITAEVNAVDELRTTQLRYAQILDSVQDMIFCKNERLVVTYANAATCRYYGMSAAELRGLTDVPYNQIDFTKQYNQDDRDVFELGKSIERAAEPNMTPSGDVRYFHTVKTPVFDEGGKVRELVGVSRDITERRRELEGQRQLAIASEFLGRSIGFETTLANVAKAMVPAIADWCAIDLLEDGQIRRLAVEHPDPEKVKLAYELERRYPVDPNAPTGVPAVLRTGQAELVPDIPDELLVAGARDAEHLEIARALKLKSYIVVPMLARERVLGAITLVGEGTRKLDERDLAFAQELSRRASAALENALLYREVRELNVGLERRVEERTSALTEANKELEAFSYTVSHDLRAPVRHISGFADLLRKHAGTALDDKAKHYLDTIKNAATQMGSLVDGLLAFSRLGRAEVTKRRVSLAEVVESLRQELEPDTRDRKIAWRTGTLPVVIADPTMLRVVVSNLLANAVKYTRGRDEAQIEIGAERGVHDDVVWVKDNGAGFKMEYAHKLFGVFQRLHADAEFEGTGIGLASARRIVNKHGGRIWAEGQPGQGATFYFTLPRGE